MMENARKNPNFKTLNRLIQVVKQVFREQNDEGGDGADDIKKDKEGRPLTKQNKKNAVQVFSQTLGSEEYLRLLQFFANELPTLILQLSGVPNKLGKSAVSVNKIYGKVSSKHAMLMKSFSANFTRLLGEALTEQTLAHIEHFFINGVDVVRCVLPHKTYVKKLANACAKISATYSRVEKAGIILGFNTLTHLVRWSENKSLLETAMKKMYNEFARESKIGGGGMQVHERLRICQNCFVELLSFDRSLGY